MMPAYQGVLTRIYRLRRFGWKLGLERIRALLEFLGHPERSFPALQVGGSNGKGSVVAGLDAVLRAGGYRVGRYTSPHLVDFRERITIGGRKISRGEVQDYYRRVRPFMAQQQARGDAVTFFELSTGLAFDCFARRGVEVAVVEVGLGGRYDATSALPRVLLTVLSSICREHEDVLGRGLARVAGEKAALIRPAVAVVCAAQVTAAMKVIDRQARRQGAPLYVYGRDFTARPRRLCLDGSRLDFQMTGRRWLNVDFPLSGRHQLENAGLILSACRLLAERGFPLTEQAVRRGLRSIDWPGRLQVIGRRPPIVVDTACNPGALTASLAALDELCPGPRRVVFSLLRDKDLPTMARLLRRGTAAVYVTAAGEEGRRRDPREVCRVLRRGGLPCRCFSGPLAALAQAKKETQAGEMVLVTGSLFLAGEILAKKLGDGL